MNRVKSDKINKIASIDGYFNCIISLLEEARLAAG
jgi:hypothetical protein